MTARDAVTAASSGSAAAAIAQALFDQSPFSTVLYDAAGHVVALNAAFTALWGARLEDVPANYTVLTDPQLEKQGILPSVRRAFAGEAVTTPPVRYAMSEASTRGEGPTIWTEAHVHPIRGASGDVINVVLTHVDITSRMLAEFALRESVERITVLQSVTAAFAQALTADEVAAIMLREVTTLGAVLSVVYLLAPDGQTLVASIQHGLSEEAMRPFQRIPIDARRLPADVARTQQPRYVSNPEALLEGYPDAGPLIAASAARSWAALPMVQDNLLLGAFTIGFPASREFTAPERAHLEAFAGQCAQALERARLYDAERAARRDAERTAARLEALQRGTGELTGALTPAAVADVIVRAALPVLGATRFALALLDATRDGVEVVGAHGYTPTTVARYRFIPIDTVFPLCDVIRSGVAIILSSGAERAERYPHLAQLREENGTGAMAAFPLRGNGRIVGAIGFNWSEERTFSTEDIAFLDVLAQQCGQALERARLYEDERRARNEAEQANRAKGDFLAAMSHELRTPLNGIGGYIELLDMGLRGPVTDAQRADLARIRRNQQHLLLLIEDVLSFARVEAGRLEVDDDAVPMDSTLRSLEAMIGPQALAGELQFVYESCDPSLRARGDAGRIVQICANLLANAIKATPAGGTVRLACAGTDDRVEVRVVDSGSGIPAEKLETIFLPFTQLGRSLNSPRAGAGLGLSISRGLATAMGGSLGVQSTEGQGATFTLTLRRDR